MEDYGTRHGPPNLAMHLDMEYEVPVSVAVISKDGQAMVDNQFVPSPAFEPCFIRDGGGMSVEALSVAAKLSDSKYDGHFSRPARRMLTKVKEPGNVYLSRSKWEAASH